MLFPFNFKNPSTGYSFKESSGSSTTDEDEPKTQDKPLKQIGTFPNADTTKYKTELCKEFQLHNFCRYGMKCKFAHGRNELVYKQCNDRFKSKPCKSFFTKLACSYGSRCQF